MARHLVLTFMKNEGVWLLEWVAWQLSIGFDHILAYTNDCEDGTDRMFDRLAAMGIATQRDNHRGEGQRASYQIRALRKARRERLLNHYDYTAILDADEFLNVHTGDGTVGALIAATGNPDAISLPWRLFGNSGHVEFRPGFVTETLKRCATLDGALPAEAWGMKSVIRTAAFEVFGVHRPRVPVNGDWNAVRWVNASGHPMPSRFHELSHGGWRFARDCISYELGQVNHYAVKYAHSFVLKALRGRPHGAIQRDEAYWNIMNRNEDTDLTILAKLPRARAIHADLLRDPVLAALDREATAWHAERIRTVLAQPGVADLFARMQVPA